MNITNFDELRDAVKANLNIVEVLRNYTEVDYRGNGICPFHSDTRKGNFKVYSNTNRYKCFACGANGDALQVIQLQRGKDFITTIYELGYELGLICEDEMKNKRIMPNVRAYKELKTNGVKQYKHAPKKQEVYKSTSKKELTDDEISLFDITYRIFSKYCGLDESDMEHLICDRMVGSDRLSDYFSIRNVKEKGAIEKTVSLLEKKGYTKEDIIKVPGFALNKKGEVCLASYVRGIGMKARNAEGKVVGIQVRTELEDKKYLWLSSSSKGGASCSTPIAVEYPKNIIENGILNIEKTIADTNDTICITEGKFKATAMAREFNSVSIGIAGINNWRKKVRKDYQLISSKKNFKNLVVFPDADCCYNPSIFIQFKEMLALELQGIKQEVYIAHWNIKYGKGIDDVIHTGEEQAIKYLKFEDYCILFNKFLLEANMVETKEEKTEIYNKIFNL